MGKKFSVIRYLSDTLKVFGITTLLLNIFTVIFGKDAEPISSIFALGNSGIAVKTGFQFLALAAIIMAFRFIFMTDSIIERMPLAVRIIAMFFSTFAVIVAFIVMFGWFPINNIKAWVFFLICFIVSCTVSTVISTLSEKKENKRLEEALRSFKEAN